jgi:pyruvate dehydrogenase E2 component (dihydrolipoamide acetyltransferase)
MGIFRMPSLGADMEAGTLVEWLKKPGDVVTSGDIIAVVETQKGAIEIEVFESGTIESQLLPVGATVPVGTGLAMIRTADTAGPPKTPPPPPLPQAPPVRPSAAQVAPSVLAASAPPAISAEKKVSPAARQFASEHGIDPSSVQGTGPEGAVVYVDVENAWLHGAKAEPAKPVPAPRQAPAGLGAMRAAIAAAMARSKREIPHYYLGHAVDVTKCIAWMTARNEARPPDERLLFSALLLKALALSLGKFSEFNGHFRDGSFEPAAKVHAGMAIALRGGGLVAPAIHDTAALTLDQVMSGLRDLANRVRAGRFRGSELADPTITLTSLGERGVDWLQPVIYPPQVAIVGAGAAQLRPWILEGKVVPRQVCQLSLAADHRVSDGHRGALLLREMAERLQSPEAL